MKKERRNHEIAIQPKNAQNWRFRAFFDDLRQKMRQKTQAMKSWKICGRCTKYSRGWVWRFGFGTRNLWALV